MNNKQLLKKAKKKVKQKKDFFTHVIIMAGVTVFLLAIQIFARPWDDWGVLIPISLMSLSVVIHYVMLFGMEGINEKANSWTANALKEEYLKLKELEDEKEYLLQEDFLKLSQIEEHYRDEDFV